MNGGITVTTQLPDDSRGNSVEFILTQLLKTPGIRIDRTSFLSEQFKSNIHSNVQRLRLLDQGPLALGITEKELHRKAKQLINLATAQSTTLSFAAGLPGGFAMAATIPADTLQFLATSIRLSQQLAYLYGYQDLWENGVLNEDRIRNQFLLYMGTMFGVGGAAAGLRALSPRIAQQIVTKLPQQALTRTIYYPLVKRIAASIGFKMNKKLFAQGVGKMIPLAGGVISGGFTLIALQQMGGRLQKELALSVDYTNQQQERDLKEIFDIVDIDSTDEASAATNLSDVELLSEEDFLTQQASIHQMYATRTITATQRDFLLNQLKRGHENGNR